MARQRPHHIKPGRDHRPDYGHNMRFVNDATEQTPDMAKAAEATHVESARLVEMLARGAGKDDDAVEEQRARAAVHRNEYVRLLAERVRPNNYYHGASQVERAIGPMRSAVTEVFGETPIEPVPDDATGLRRTGAHLVRAAKVAYAWSGARALPGEDIDRGLSTKHGNLAATLEEAIEDDGLDMTQAMQELTAGVCDLIEDRVIERSVQHLMQGGSFAEGAGEYPEDEA